MNSVLLKIGVAIIILGVFGLLVSSGLPDAALIAAGFTVAILAVGLGLRLRPDEPEDGEG